MKARRLRCTKRAERIVPQTSMSICGYSPDHKLALYVMGNRLARSASPIIALDIRKKLGRQSPHSGYADGIGTGLRVMHGPVLRYERTSKTVRLCR